MKPHSTPKLKEKRKVISNLGKKWIDEYYWFRNKKNPAVLKHLKAENKFTESFFTPYKKELNLLVKEMKGRISESESSPAYRFGKHRYFYKHVPKKDFEIFCRLDQNHKEEILLDLNKLAKNKKSASLGVVEVNVQETLMAYSLDLSGSEFFELFFKDLKTKKLLNYKIEKVNDGFFSPCGKYFFYTELNKEWQPAKLKRHEIGTSPKKDLTLFENKNFEYYLDVTLSDSDQYIIINLSNGDCSYVNLIDLNDSRLKPIPFIKRKAKVKNTLNHAEGVFYLLSNKDSNHYDIFTTTQIKNQKWKKLIASDKKTVLDEVLCFKNYLAIRALQGGTYTLFIYNIERKSMQSIQLPYPSLSLKFGDNFIFDDQHVRIEYSTMITPNRWIDVELSTGKCHQLKETHIPSGHNEKNYCLEKIDILSTNKSKIPVTLAYKKGMIKDGNNPLLLLVYGSYGVVLGTYFDENLLSLMNRGFIIALAGVRGGGEYGDDWHDAGKMFERKNTFIDTIACGDYFVKHKYSRPQLMSLWGTSAGGMINGFVANERPELFKTHIAEVPFVDCLNTMLDSKLPLTKGEYVEWGNPEKSKKAFHYIRSYAPYENVRPQTYPSIYIIAGYNDQRVTYWEPSKWCARLRKCNTGSNQILQQTNFESGHFGASGRYGRLMDQAKIFQFLISQLNECTE